MKKPIELEFVFLGMSDGTSKAGNPYSIAKFFDMDVSEGFDFFIPSAALKSKIKEVKPLEPVTAFFKVESWQGKASLQLCDIVKRK